MKLIVKLLFFNIIVFFISLVFFMLILPVFAKIPVTQSNYGDVVHDAILISYGVCVVFTISFFFLSTSLVQEVADFIER